MTIYQGCWGVTLFYARIANGGLIFNAYNGKQSYAIAFEDMVPMLESKKKVMIVEDNHLNRKLFNDLLQVHGYDTIMTDRPTEAVQMVRQHRPHLILMDIQLPEISGLEVIKRILADPTIADIPIVAVTAFAMKGDQERILEQGCKAYLAKPISVSTFIATVQKFVREDAA